MWDLRFHGGDCEECHLLDVAPCRTRVNWRFGRTSFHTRSTRRHIPGYGIHKKYSKLRLALYQVTIYIYIYIGKLPNWVTSRAGETLSGEQPEFTTVTSPNPTESERLKPSVIFLCHLLSVTSASEPDLSNFGRKIKYDLYSIRILCT